MTSLSLTTVWYLDRNTEYRVFLLKKKREKYMTMIRIYTVTLPTSEVSRMLLLLSGGGNWQHQPAAGASHRRLSALNEIS